MDVKQLRAIRQSLQQTQEQMAQSLGISKATYVRYEQGKWPIKQLVAWRAEQLQAGIGNS